jgi:photosystem II stability/assembly factor-like uncharacterized protein
LEFLQKRENEIQQYKNALNLRHIPFDIPGKWTIQGPGNLGGRVNAIAVNPKDENIIFIGFSHGGAYRSMDGGNSWTPVFDNEISLYISDIAIDPKNPQTIYIATGDHSGGFYCGQGNGIYKSTNNGNSWQQSGLKETRVISKILIDYKNPQIVYAASLGYSYEKNSQRGLYKSTDGGTNWNKILYLNDSTGITDLIMHPVNPNILFAVSWNKLGTNNRAMIIGPDGQIFKSIDGGNNWQRLTNGLPADSINGRIAIAISKSQPNILYARYVRTYTDCGNGNNLYGIYRSDNTGDSWSQLPALEAGSGLPCDCLGGFGWYFQNIIVNPKDADDLYILGIEMYRSTDGGNFWDLAVPPWFTYEVHADKHAFVFLKNGDFLLGTDGGLYRHNDFFDSWDDIENIPTNQVYRVAYNPHYPENYYGGLQDNGSTGGNKDDIDNWDRIYGGDGFQMAFNEINPEIFYAEYQNGALQQYYYGDWRPFTSGLRGNKNWDFPYMISRHNPSQLIAGSDQIYFNENDTIDDWKAISPNLVSSSRYPSRSNPTITSLDESPLDPKTLIAGTINGNVWITKEFDKNWINISSGLPVAYISSVKTSFKNSNTFYVSLSGHRGNDFNDYIYKTTDQGLNWQSMQSNLPNLPVYDILIYSSKQDSVIFAATHIGVYASLDGGLNWGRIGENMPFIEVFDLEINESEKTLIAATFGKSIMTFPLDDIFKIHVNSTELSTLQFVLYPNPVSNELIISGRYSDLENANISILNSEGKKVIDNYFCKDAKNIIPVQSLNNGIYYLVIYKKSKTAVSKFIIQN